MNIKDLARHLDLSIGTVSRALNQKPDVSEATRKRVLDAALKLGYSANASGRSLRRGSTQTIGFLLETGISDMRAGDSFFMRVIDAMQAHLDAEGYDLIILPCNSNLDSTEFLRRLIARGIAEAIVVTATKREDPRIELLLQSHLPFLTLGRTAQEDRHPWIDLDFEGFIATSFDLLAARGHRRIAMTYSIRESNICHLLRNAFAAAHARHGLPFDPGLALHCESNEFGGSTATRDILAMPDPPTAVIFSYESMAIGAYAALAEAGKTPGPDLSIVTLRKSRQLRFIDPPVTAFEIDLAGLGHALGAQILRCMRRETPMTRIIWPQKLILTASVAPVVL
ncbi:LacI family DNA-binding transcriptional regulator [Paracoccus sp. (in: a-proteobacteria)]|uniref:LacI family DNA-binding transcriptional regulator n=1 Tax=Paracoccus sp. TaxID=267 RepID=UPI003A84C93E